jgi:HipA-like C-terminal domain
MPSVGGKAPKWVLSREEDSEDFFIAKMGATNGRAETLTELFNNQLGEVLGFEMAHSGIGRLDSGLYFLTKNFRAPGERLVHGSLMIEEVFGASRETERIHVRSEQAFYSVDFLKQVIEDFCQHDATAVFGRFIEMLVFDALIGSMDRHAQNWGVLQHSSLPPRFRLAPIFDSARALLWLLPEGKLLAYYEDESKLLRYVDASKPCIGPPRNHPKVNVCNHFDVVESLMELYPHLVRAPLGRVSEGGVRKAGRMLESFPYLRYLSSIRRKLMLKVLEIRADRLMALAERLA